MTCPTCGTEAAADARFCAQCGARLEGNTIALAPELRDRVLTTLRAEHRLVTVVFADMTGSVRRTRDLDAEGATALVNPLLETMVELMVQHGGRIDRFLGDGVLAVFGVPAAHEDDPIRAVRAAVGLRERAAELGLEVTVGVNTGRVYFGPVGSSLHEELTVMGPVVNLAARLQGAAASGEVLVGAATREHISASFDVSRRMVDIKGMEVPVESFVVERLSADPDKVRGVEGLTSRLVGRQTEMDRLTGALGNRGAVVAIVGDAGLGKSRLAREFRAACGCSWIEGRCQALTIDRPFSGFVDLLRRSLGRSDPAAEAIVAELEALPALTATDVEEISPFLAALLGRTFGDARDVIVAETEPSLRRHLTIEAIARWLTASTSSDQTVVFIDDLQWADDLTVDTLARLAGVSESILVVAATRPEPVRPLDRLRGDRDVIEVELTELSHDQTVELVRRLLTVGGLPPETESRLVEWAGGNPFYVEELIRSLIQQEMIVRRDGEWTDGPVPVRLELPESIDGLVMSRFDRLSTATRRAGQVAAVLDRPFDVDLFEAVAGGEIARSLDQLIGADFLRRAGDVSGFTHDLVREAVYASLLPSQKLELHEMVAEAIRRLDPDDHESLAYHYDRSSNDRAAVEYLHLAAVRAFDAYANATATAYLERGLDRLEGMGSDSLSARYLVLRARMHERASEYDEALGDLEAAAALVDPAGVEAAEIWRLTGRAHHLGDSFEAAFEAFDRAEAILDGVDDPAAWIELQADRAQAMYFGGRGRELPDLISRVKPVVETHGTPGQRLDVFELEAFEAFLADAFSMAESTVDMCRQALALAEQGTDPGRLATSRFRLGFCLLWADRSREAIPLLEVATADSRRLGDVMLETRSTAYLAIALRRTGLVDRARDAAIEASAVAARVDDRYYLGHAESVLGWAHWRLGDLDESERHARAAIERWGTLERPPHLGVDVEFAWLAAWPLCAIAAARGDDVAAAEHLALVSVPWERPMSPALAAAVAAARESPTTGTVRAALDIAESEHLL